MAIKDKHEWCALILLFCLAGSALAAAAVALGEAARALGLTAAQGLGLLLIGLAVALLAGAVRISRWAGTKLAARRMWRRVDRRIRRERAGGVQCR
jgi:hypothetical protein